MFFYKFPVKFQGIYILNSYKNNSDKGREFIFRRSVEGCRKSSLRMEIQFKENVDEVKDNSK